MSPPTGGRNKESTHVQENQARRQHPTVQTLAEADSTLGRIAALQRNLTLLETGMNEETAAIKLKAEAKAEPIRQQMADLGASLARYAEAHKEELFTDKLRSRALSFGTIGYRYSSILDTLGRTTWKEVLGILETKGLEQFIRKVPEVDREALRKASPSLLKDVRCVVRDKDEFFYETESYELAEGGGPGEAA